MLSDFYNKKLKKTIVGLVTTIALTSPFYTINQVKAEGSDSLLSYVAKYMCDNSWIDIMIYREGDKESIYRISAPSKDAIKYFEEMSVELNKECKKLQAKLHKDNNYCPPNDLACADTSTSFIPADEVFYTPYKGVKW